MIRIERGIPLPEKVVGRNKGKSYPTYPFDKLKVGESFSIKSDKDSMRKIQLRIGCAAYWFRNRRDSSKKFTVRQQENRVRCWRIK